MEMQNYLARTSTRKILLALALQAHCENLVERLLMTNPYTAFGEEISTMYDWLPWGDETGGVPSHIHNTYFERNRQRVDHFLRHQSSSEKARLQLESWLSRGQIKFGKLGMDLTHWARLEEEKLCFLEGSRLNFTHRVGLGDNVVSELLDVFYPTPMQRFIHTVDMPSWFHGFNGCDGAGRARKAAFYASLSPKEHLMLRQFLRDGYVVVGHWDGLPEPGDASPMRRAELLPKGLKTNATRTIRDHTPVVYRSFLNPMLNEGSLLRKLVHGYLQDADVSFHGASYGYLAKTARHKKDYSNAMWHHDGCGTRLKAFVYLVDVDESTGVTEIAEGSQRTSWFQTTHFFGGAEESLYLKDKVVEDHVVSPRRFRSSQFLRDAQGRKPGTWRQRKGNVTRKGESSSLGHHSLARMRAPRFGGFIFDTNTMHRAHILGKVRAREVYVLDFASMRHMRELPRQQHNRKYDPDVGVPHGVCPRPLHSSRVNWKYCPVYTELPQKENRCQATTGEEYKIHFK